MDSATVNVLFLYQESVIKQDGDACQELGSFDMVVTIIPGLETILIVTKW